MNTQLTDVQLELDLKLALENKQPLSELAPILLEAFASHQKAKKQTALRFLQLHPEWKYWRDEFEPWLRSQVEWPWELIIPWLTTNRLTFSLEEREQLKKVWSQQKALNIVAKNLLWSVVFEELPEWRAAARFDLQRKILQIRDLLFEELKTWKSQRMREQEQKVLRRLNKKFPQDRDIQKESNNFRESQAFETLHDKLRERRNKVIPLRFEDEVTELPPLWRQELEDKANLFPDLCYDLTLHCCFCEDWVWALHLVTQAPESQARDWLELEILMKLRRYVDVLQALTTIEMRWPHDSETFFATAYIRAQAYYGLGRKQKALEILESLLASRPLYRQGAELLSIWRGPA